MNFMTCIDDNSTTPIYKQLYLYIKQEIIMNRIMFNQKLPSKRKLSKLLNISQNTVQTAYNQLLEEGYITSIERSGYFVCHIGNTISLSLVSKSEKNNFEILDSPIKYDFSFSGVDVHSFPFITWRKLYKEIINYEDKSFLHVSPSQGDISLRKSIAHYLRDSRGVNCEPNQIIISSGTEFLTQIIIHLFDEATIFGLEDPGYDKPKSVLKTNNRKIVPISIDNDGISINDPNIMIPDVLCVTPSHQFPTGIIMPITRRIQLLNWANESNHRYIIEDDYDSEFKYSGNPIPALYGIDSNAKVIYLGSFSKSLSPAIRISYMVLPEHLLQRYTTKLSYMLCSVPTIEQNVLYRFISEGYFERHLNKMRNSYRKKYEFLIKKLKEMSPNIEILGSDSGLNIVIKLNLGMNEYELIEKALLKGVKVYGISNYYFDYNKTTLTPSLLLGYASMSMNDIESALALIKTAWFGD